MLLKFVWLRAVSQGSVNSAISNTYTMFSPRLLTYRTWRTPPYHKTAQSKYEDDNVRAQQYDLMHYLVCPHEQFCTVTHIHWGCLAGN